MRKTLFRRVAIGAVAAAAAVGLSTLFASPASAHSSSVTGSAECVSVDGKYQITWTLTNDYNKVVTLSNVHLVTSDSNATLSTTTVPTTIDARPPGSPLQTVKFTSVVSKPATSAQLTYDAHWADNFPKDGVAHVSSPVIQLTGPCPSKSPTPQPSRSVSPSASAPPGLPVTGSNTTLPMVGTGAALIAGGAALIITLRRRRRIQFTAE